MQAGKGWRRLDGQIEDPSHSLEIFGKAKRVVPKLQKPLTLVHKNPYLHTNFCISEFNNPEILPTSPSSAGSHLTE